MFNTVCINHCLLLSRLTSYWAFTIDSPSSTFTTTPLPPPQKCLTTSLLMVIVQGPKPVPWYLSLRHGIAIYHGSIHQRVRWSVPFNILWDHWASEAAAASWYVNRQILGSALLNGRYYRDATIYDHILELREQIRHTAIDVCSWKASFVFLNVDNRKD